MQYRASVARAAVALAASLAMSASMAAIATAQGRFLQANVIADGDWSVSVSESLTDKTVSLVVSFQSASTPAVDTWSRTVALRDVTLFAPQYIGTNNAGDSVYASVDFGHWTFAATGTLSAPPADALFKTAYGQETLTARAGVFRNPLPTVDNTPDFSGISVSSNYAANELPLISLEDYTFQGIPWRFLHSGITPYYAKPSTTEPRCQSLSCLDYEAGLYTIQTYVLTFALAETIVPASPVPEPGTWALALVGLGTLALARRRRR